jgi:DNA-directed RNA polymerase specialized sigma24 family protein
MSSDATRQHAPNKTDFVRITLDTLARRYYAPLASFFRKRTRGAPEVQDLVQQVFLRAADRPLNRRKQIQPRRPPLI